MEPTDLRKAFKKRTEDRESQVCKQEGDKGQKEVFPPPKERSQGASGLRGKRTPKIEEKGRWRADVRRRKEGKSDPLGRYRGAREERLRERSILLRGSKKGPGSRMKGKPGEAPSDKKRSNQQRNIGLIAERGSGHGLLLHYRRNETRLEKGRSKKATLRSCYVNQNQS